MWPNARISVMGGEQAASVLATVKRDGIEGKGGAWSKDEEEAFKWFKRAADQNYPDAEENLGIMYEKGLGEKQDYFEAVRWYQSAADHGDVQARQELERLQT